MEYPWARRRICLFGDKISLPILIQKLLIRPDESNGADNDFQLSSVPQEVCIVLRVGNVEHPKNCYPIFGPDFTVRISSALPHFGHCRSAVGLPRRLRFCTCSRWVARDGARRPFCRACNMASTSASLNARCWNDLMK